MSLHHKRPSPTTPRKKPPGRVLFNSSQFGTARRVRARPSPAEYTPDTRILKALQRKAAARAKSATTQEI